MLDPARTEAILNRIGRIPIVDSLRIEMKEFDEGWCRGVVPRQRCFDGVYQSYHGGLLMTAADSVACFAIMTLIGPEQALTTTDMNIRFLAPCLSDVTVVARVIKLGRTLVPVHVDLFDAENVHVAVAQVTYMRLERMPNRP